MSIEIPTACTTYMRGGCQLRRLKSPLCSTQGADRGLILPPWQKKQGILALCHTAMTY
jgi:hypothetical protein